VRFDVRPARADAATTRSSRSATRTPQRPARSGSPPGLAEGAASGLVRPVRAGLGVGREERMTTAARRASPAVAPEEALARLEVKHARLAHRRAQPRAGQGRGVADLGQRISQQRKFIGDLGAQLAALQQRRAAYWRVGRNPAGRARPGGPPPRDLVGPSPCSTASSLTPAARVRRLDQQAAP
jgi:hypothetical protein